ncbi:MAG: hypothetical protein JRF59_14850 [Deltaproteobacteria bacterium]|nr:hypothetical protein [Deltaproteobacteria bacterium]MBW1950949.1 hypothetical protein [Deltaproteobacteria bacterium]MBW2009185.1 hypothetical protein [Deltaproteobacteria bacterium]MBW2349095.1 hypothetical protein [Deltaproteobacteria bacterium]
MTIRIDRKLLEGACKEIIETILFCLPSARKGTVYLIGSPPQMVATRITSGILQEGTGSISWGLPEKSDYNPPGKPWSDYRDEPGRQPEAMAWCVERQKSWTVHDPEGDPRSATRRGNGSVPDSHHMEPVLIPKKDLFPRSNGRPEYPRNYDGEVLWRDSEYVVAAVIKIHFQPYRIRIGSPETRLIKRLSRTLGTELLSFQLRQESMEAMRRLAQDKIDSCNLLADSLRNAVTKSGLINSLVKLELGFLRDQWERALLENSDKRNMKREAVEGLRELLGRVKGRREEIRGLAMVQERALDLLLPPERAETWIRMQVEERWNRLLENAPQKEGLGREVKRRIDQLKRSFYLGKSPDLLAGFRTLPDSVKEEWVALIYQESDRVDGAFLDRLTHMLEHTSLGLPFQEKSRKTLLHLKTLAKVMGDLESNTNVALRQFLNSRNGEMEPRAADAGRNR